MQPHVIEKQQLKSIAKQYNLSTFYQDIPSSRRNNRYFVNFIVVFNSTCLQQPQPFSFMQRCFFIFLHHHPLLLYRKSLNSQNLFAKPNKRNTPSLIPFMSVTHPKTFQGYIKRASYPSQQTVYCSVSFIQNHWIEKPLT